VSYNQPPPPPPGYGPPPPPPPGYGAGGGYYYGPPQTPGAPAPHASRATGSAMIGIFIGALVGIAVLVGIIVLASQPQPPEGCPVGEVCPPEPQPTFRPRPTLQPGQAPLPGQTALPTPVSNALPFVGGTVWRSPTLGYSFEYDADIWRVEASEDAYAHLRVNSTQRDIELDVIGFSGDVSVDAALQNVYNQTDSFIIGRAQNTRRYDAVLGAGIGYVRGEGDVFSGTFKNADGTPGDPAGITVMAATNGRVTIAMIVLVHFPDSKFAGGTLQHAARATADSIVQTFLWQSN
jgi:hypothetical protein